MSEQVKPKWQRAKLIGAPVHQDTLGRFLWTEIGRVEECGVYRCSIPAIYINHYSFGGQCVCHLDLLEMQPEFANDVEIIRWTEFLAGRER